MIDNDQKTEVADDKNEKSTSQFSCECCYCIEERGVARGRFLLIKTRAFNSQGKKTLFCCWVFYFFLNRSKYESWGDEKRIRQHKLIVS